MTTSTKQCAFIFKKGTNCKRNVKSGFIKCDKHLPKSVKPNFFKSPNVITQHDFVPDIDLGFKNDFKLKPYQKATIKKMLNHEDKFFVTTTIPKKFEDIISRELEDKNDVVRHVHGGPEITAARTYNFERINRTTSQLNFHTNIGVLSNNVGSGKTSVVLSLIHI